MTSKIIIPKELNDFIEALSYEVESRKSLLTFALSKNLDNTDAFKRYHKEYQDYFIQYEAAKQNLQDEYILPDIGDRKVNWELDFNTNTITIEDVM